MGDEGAQEQRRAGRDAVAANDRLLVGETRERPRGRVEPHRASWMCRTRCGRSALEGASSTQRRRARLRERQGSSKKFCDCRCRGCVFSPERRRVENVRRPRRPWR
jgi:hypothetical protein